MKTASRIALGIVAILILAACGQRYDAPMREAAMSQDVSLNAKPAAPLNNDGATSEQRRYLALKYALTVQNDADVLEKSWKDLNERCRQLQCDILEGSFTRSRNGVSPRGLLHARIAPDKLNDFLQAAEQSGSVVATTMSSEDKTAAVIDVEARIKNMTELRDRLRTMLQTRGSPLKDVLEVERELANVQSQLDSLAGMRKALAAETEKIEITIDFVSRDTFINAGKVSPLREAWDDLAEVFLRSVGSLMLFAAAVLPWLVIVVPLVWLLGRLWRQRRERRAALRE